MSDTVTTVITNCDVVIETTGRETTVSYTHRPLDKSLTAARDQIGDLEGLLHRLKLLRDEIDDSTIIGAPMSAEMIVARLNLLLGDRR